MWKPKRTWIVKAILSKRTMLEISQYLTSNFTTKLSSLAQKQTHRPTEYNRRSTNKSMKLYPSDFSQRIQTAASSTNGAKKTGCPHVRVWNCISHHGFSSNLEERISSCFLFLFCLKKLSHSFWIYLLTNKHTYLYFFSSKNAHILPHFWRIILPSLEFCAECSFFQHFLRLCAIPFWTIWFLMRIVPLLMGFLRFRDSVITHCIYFVFYFVVVHLF
jgi:hypothetical protein